MMERTDGRRSFAMNLTRLRVISIVAPVVFLAVIEALSIFALGILIPNEVVRFAVTFLLIASGAVPFAVWVFRVIEGRERNAAESAILVNSVADLAIFMLDPAGIIRTWNKGGEHLKGFTSDDVVGHPLAMFYPADDVVAGLPQANLKRAAERGSTEYEGWRVRKDGSRFWANVMLTAVRNGDGTLVGFSAVTRDMTQRMQEQTQIQRLNDELAMRVGELGAAKADAEHRNRQLTAVNASVAAISSALEPAQVLQRIVDSARDLVDANYGALGVADEEGTMVQFITSGITKVQRDAIGTLPRGRGLLGVLIRDRVPLRLADIRGHPESFGFPANHPPLKCLLGVPILFHGQSIGNLYMAERRDGGNFDDEDLRILELLANHAAVAIRNAQLYDEARGARDRLAVWGHQLEEEVKKRTRQIERQSHELTRRVLQAQEEERKRIARELHDETAQSLSTLLINIDLLELRLPPDSTSEPDDTLRAGIDRLRTIARRTLDETRALSHGLRPAILDDVGLVAAVEWFADEFAHSFDGTVHVRANQPEPRLPSEIELALFRIAQEALTNAGKHSRADSVDVGLRFNNKTAELIVADNGRGFDETKLARPTRKGGLGLYGMRERAELIGADLEISSDLGAGTRISVCVSIKPGLERTSESNGHA